MLAVNFADGMDEVNGVDDLLPLGLIHRIGRCVGGNWDSVDCDDVWWSMGIVAGTGMEIVMRDRAIVLIVVEDGESGL